MSEESDFPEVGEIVVVRITKVLDYGAFAVLLEYEDIKGFVHISQVASGWIKNIRNFVKEGEVRAAKVQNVDLTKNQIDLNFTRVSAAAQRAKINEFKQMKRERKLIEALAKSQKKSFDEAWDEVAEPLIKKYGSLVKAFRKIALQEKEAATDVGPKWINPLIEMIDKSVTVPVKTIKGILKISVPTSNGIETIKEALTKGFSPSKEADVEIFYLGSGKYLIKANSHDFKVLEREMGIISDNIIKFIESHGGKASFEREE
ncbi:MAG: hypothetical protein CL943_02740 [Candidatus Diapherotrites archaeon]|uniref:S1 motif domain-containing protein n=1 Tax=Candidatus Iainarchaeum sp. TaxID=3101447 RepID=A0A2D6M196_9ARCH|nr:hypothetical protein [Candidatus Diapherotrites archaeon]|tara:strand:+ start:2174 stop:2953 length:780 start_codon:yes stop_codon:yes gene_type:complete